MNAFDELSRFSATPEQIHNALRAALAEDVYLDYLRWVEKTALLAMRDDPTWNTACERFAAGEHAMVPDPLNYASYLGNVPPVFRDARECTVAWHTHRHADPVNTLPTCRFDD